MIVETFDIKPVAVNELTLFQTEVCSEESSIDARMNEIISLAIKDNEASMGLAVYILFDMIAVTKTLDDPQQLKRATDIIDEFINRFLSKLQSINQIIH